MDSNDLKRSGRTLRQGSPDLGSVPVQTGHGLGSEGLIMPDWDLPQGAAPASVQQFAQDFTEDLASPSAELDGYRPSVLNDHYSDQELMPPGWIRLTAEIQVGKAQIPADLRRWLLEGQGHDLLQDTAWLLTVPDPRETRVFVALTEVEVGPGDLLSLGRPWEPAETENVRCKHLVRGDCFRLTPGEWAHIWLAAFHDRAVFRVLPGSKLGAMLLPTE